LVADHRKAVHVHLGVVGSCAEDLWRHVSIATRLTCRPRYGQTTTTPVADAPSRHEHGRVSPGCT
jgi:hypothetical protein